MHEPKHLNKTTQGVPEIEYTITVLSDKSEDGTRIYYYASLSGPGFPKEEVTSPLVRVIFSESASDLEEARAKVRARALEQGLEVSYLNSPIP